MLCHKRIHVYEFVMSNIVTKAVVLMTSALIEIHKVHRYQLMFTIDVKVKVYKFDQEIRLIND